MRASSAGGVRTALLPTPPLREHLRELLRHAILAPSTQNTQPWRFRIGTASIDVHTDPGRELSVIDPMHRQLHMSVGAALFNLRIALRCQAHAPLVSMFPDSDDPTLIARLDLGAVSRPTALERELFDAIPRRRTNRQPFAQRPVSYKLIDELTALAESEGATLTRLGPRDKVPLAQVISLAEQAQFADRAFRRELSRWLVPSGSRRGDGIPFSKKEYGSRSPLGPLVVRTFDVGGKVAAKEVALAKASPVLLVLGTPADTRRDWVAAGQAMQAVLRRGTHLGLSASFLNQPLELEALRPRVAELAGDGSVPQLVLRMGFGPPVLAATPRRPLEDVLLPSVA